MAEKSPVTSMYLTNPIFLSDSVDRVYGVHQKHHDLEPLASDGSEFIPDITGLKTTLNGVSVRAIYHPPHLYMTKTGTLNSVIYDGASSNNPYDYHIAKNAKIIIPSSVFPMFRSEMKDGDRLVISTKTMKYKYQIAEADHSPKKEVTGIAVLGSEEPANTTEIEYLQSLVEKHVLKPRDTAFIATMLPISTRELIYFFNKAYRCKDKLFDSDSGQQTLLTIVSNRQQWDVCFKLLELGATPDAGHHGDSITPLHMAAKAGQSDLLEALLLHNANPNMTTGPWSYKGECKRMTALRFTLLYKGKDEEESANVRKSMIQTLLESGADPMTIDTTELAEFIEPLELMLETFLVAPTNSVKHTRLRQKYQQYLEKLAADGSDIQKKLGSGCTFAQRESMENLLSLLDKLASKADTVPTLQNVCRAVIRPELNFPIRRSIKDLNLPGKFEKFISDR
ncbi:hypothetical protein [Endozoicomonas sp. ALB091]|uniref:hypothetical protein n=2 Tax=Endozoicomonas TaxID=305899 RepID=UPI003BB7F48E